MPGGIDRLTIILLSPFPHAVKHGLDVDNRRAVKSLQIQHPELRRSNFLYNPHPVEPHRVRPVLRPGAEHATQRRALVIPGMDSQRVAAAAVQLGEHQYLLTRQQVLKPCDERSDTLIFHDLLIMQNLSSVPRAWW